jgi:soluble lytic murein transglycosylase-like protein
MIGIISWIFSLYSTPTLETPVPTLSELSSYSQVLSAQTSLESTPSSTQIEVQLATASAPSATATPQPTATPSPTIKPTTTPSPKPKKITLAEIEELFTKYSQKYNIDREQLKRIAVCESKLNVNAKNLYYAGLYQFSESTWKSYRRMLKLNTNPDLRFDAEASINTAAWMLSTGRQSAWPNCK